MCGEGQNDTSPSGVYVYGRNVVGVPYRVGVKYRSFDPDRSVPKRTTVSGHPSSCTGMERLDPPSPVSQCASVCRPLQGHVLR